MRKRDPRRVWHLHHAESSVVFKEYKEEHAMECCQHGCDIIGVELYLQLEKEYVQDIPQQGKNQ